MPIKVVHIAGPPGSGKTTLATLLASRRQRGARHHLRLSVGRAEDGDGNPCSLRLSTAADGLDSSTSRAVNPELVFEVLPAEIVRLHQPRQSTLVFIETDAEPCFRHAYSYDVRVYLMPCPAGLNDVFRSHAQAEEAARRAMADTGEFAQEIFGLTRDPPALATAAVQRDSIKRFDPPSPTNERDRGVLAFIDRALGGRISAQFMLQPCYHALADADVVLMNQAVGPDGATAEICAHRLGVLFDRLKREGGRPIWFAACEPADPGDPLGRRALERIEKLIDGASVGAT